MSDEGNAFIPHPVAASGMIRTDGLTRSFGSTEAVVDLSLEVRRGETFGFLGPNGAGKTTTTKMLTTLLEPDRGRAEVAGYDPVDDPLEVRRRIGYLPDELPVYGSHTGLEFLTVFGRLHGIDRSEARDRSQAMLDRVGLEDVDGQSVETYSKGMKQRLGLARALLNEPDVLFLDEPASGLDPTGQKEIRALIQRVASGGATVFYCSHRLDDVQEVCDRAGILAAGRLQRVVELSDRETTVILAKVEGDPPELRQAVADLPGIVRAGRQDDVVRMEFDETPDRDRIARAIQSSGAVLLDLREATPDLERIYEETVEEGGP